MECILNINNTSSTSYAVVSEVITYKIEVQNVSANIVENVIVKELLPEELKFILSSVNVNGKKDNYSNIISGVKIGKIMPCETKVVTFEAEIIKKINEFIETRAVVEYKYQNEQQFNCDRCNSETNIILIKNPNLEIIKKADKNKVQLDDEFTYIITINNNGDLDAENVLLMDEISELVELIDGTFSIDSKIVNSVELEKGVMINDIPKGETKTIKYTVKLISGGCSGKIENKVKVRYSYTLSNGCTSYKESNESTSHLETAISNFKQISIDEYLSIPCQKPKIEIINDIKAYPKINKCNIIKTSIGRSTEGQILSGYKLVVHGVMNQVVEYVSDEPAQSLHSSHYSAPFSSYIVLPKDFVIGSKVEVEAFVDDVFFSKIDERCFFENLLILLVAKVTCCN